MTMNKLAAPFAGMILAGLAAAPVLAAPPAARPAAAPAAPAAAPAPVSGPAVPGVCTLSFQQAIAQSAVGGYMRQRLEQIVGVVRSELQPEEKSIADEDKALAAAKTTLDQQTLQTRAQALQARYAAYQQKAELRQREMKATQDKALNRIVQELEPVAQQLYTAHRCSILIDKQGVFYQNPDMDLTKDAVTGLNAKIQQFPFDREHLDTGAPAAR